VRWVATAAGAQPLLHGALLRVIGGAVAGVGPGGSGDAALYAQLLAARLAAQAQDPQMGALPAWQLEQALAWLQLQLPQCGPQYLAVVGHSLARAGCPVPAAWAAGFCAAVAAQLGAMDVHQLMLACTALQHLTGHQHVAAQQQWQAQQQQAQQQAAAAAVPGIGPAPSAAAQAAAAGGPPAAEELQQRAEALAQQQLAQLPASRLLPCLNALAKEELQPTPRLQHALAALLKARLRGLRPEQQVDLLHATTRLRARVSPAALVEAAEELAPQVAQLAQWQLLRLAEVLAAQAGGWHAPQLPPWQQLQWPLQELLYATADSGLTNLRPEGLLGLCLSLQRLGAYPRAPGLNWTGRLVAAARASLGAFSGKQLAQLLVWLAWLELHPAFEPGHVAAEQQLLEDLECRSDWQGPLLQQMAGRSSSSSDSGSSSGSGGSAAAAAAAAAGEGAAGAAELPAIWAAARHGVLGERAAAALLLRQLQPQVGAASLHVLAASARLVLLAGLPSEALPAADFVSNATARCLRELDGQHPLLLQPLLELLLAQRLGPGLGDRLLGATGAAMARLPLRALLLLPGALALGLQPSTRWLGAFCRAVAAGHGAGSGAGAPAGQLCRAVQQMHGACGRMQRQQPQRLDQQQQQGMRRALQQLFSLACCAAHRLGPRQLYQLLATGYQQQLVVPGASLPKLQGAVRAGLQDMPAPHRVSLLLLAEQLGVRPPAAWCAQQAAAALRDPSALLNASMRLDAALLLLRCMAAPGWLLGDPRRTRAAGPAAAAAARRAHRALRGLVASELALVLRDPQAVPAARLVELLGRAGAAPQHLRLPRGAAPLLVASVAARAASLPPERALQFVQLLGGAAAAAAAGRGARRLPLGPGEMDTLLLAVHPGSGAAPGRRGRLPASVALPLLRQLGALGHRPGAEWRGSLLAAAAGSLADLPAPQLLELGALVVHHPGSAPGARFVSTWLAAVVARHRDLSPLQLAEALQLLGRFRSALQSAAALAVQRPQLGPGPGPAVARGGAQLLALGPLWVAAAGDEPPAAGLRLGLGLGLVSSVARGGVIRSLRGRVQQLLRRYLVVGVRSSTSRQVLLDLIMVRAQRAAPVAGLAAAAGAAPYQRLLELRVSRLLLAAGVPAAQRRPAAAGDGRAGGRGRVQRDAEVAAAEGAVLISAPSEAVAAVMLKILDVKLASVLTRTGVGGATGLLGGASV
jgi:hypothetical protein